MNIEYSENKLTADKYNNFEMKMWNGETTPREQVERFLPHQLFSVCAIKDNEIVGIARLDGDTAYNFYINDIYVLPEYQGKGIGNTMLKKLIKYVKETCIPGTTVCIYLFSSAGKEGFYEKLGFLRRPDSTDGAGMELEFVVDGE